MIELKRVIRQQADGALKRLGVNRLKAVFWWNTSNNKGGTAGYNPERSRRIARP
ncbi:hypothetical protein HY030_04525 [Candidatus Gottesmanbacteria bacterium]|nr:hypothetical protein [Candidatus Gottesmanbacteria bacterium]